MVLEGDLSAIYASGDFLIWTPKPKEKRGGWHKHVRGNEHQHIQIPQGRSTLFRVHAQCYRQGAPGGRRDLSH